MSTTTLRTQVNVQMKEFESHIISAVSETMWTGYSTDCIIISKDKAFSCHRLILSAASPFFAKMFDTVDPARLPQIIVPDVSSQVLQMVISMIYTGESCVSAAYREEFMEVCVMLQLKGCEEFYEDTTGVTGDQFPPNVENILIEEPMEEDVRYGVNPTQYYEDEEIVIEQELTTDGGSNEIEFTPRVQTGHIGTNFIVNDSTEHTGTRVRISIDDEEIDQIHARLKNLYQKIYLNMVTKKIRISKEDFKVELVMNNRVLLNGQITCLFCAQKIEICYIKRADGRFKQWVPTMIGKHLEKKHRNLID